jgi:diguanylate cyclase (GGDEF)-like protein/PAS domain S-box-containing protein
MRNPPPSGLDFHPLLRQQLEATGDGAGAPPVWDAFLRVVDAEYRRHDALRGAALGDGDPIPAGDGERQFRELAETMAAATFVYHRSSFVYVNSEATQLSGYTRDELLQMEVWDLIHPDQRDVARERGLATLRGKPGPSRYQFQIVRPDGSVRWVDFTTRPLRYGGMSAALGTAFDITAFKDAAAALARQALVFENMSDALMITDGAGRILAWNPAAERVYGWTREEALGSGPELWLGPDVSGELTREIFQALDTAARWEGEIAFRRRDGTAGVTRTVVVPLLDVSGRRVGALGVNRDITESAAAAASLRASEERYRMMVEGSEQVFFYAHDEHGRFHYVSPSVERILGAPAHQVIGATYHVLLAEDPANIAEVDRNTEITLSAAGDLSTYSAAVRHADGHTVTLELVERARKGDDGALVVEGFARDITTRRAAERALRESEERYRTLFEESRDAIYMTTVEGRFVEVNQALVDLLGYSREELLTGGARDLYQDPPDRQRFREAIDRSGSVRDYETRLIRRNGEAIDALVSASVRRDADGAIVGYQGIIHDITERKRAEAKLAHGALHDSLTGLPNRALFMDRLELARDRIRRGDQTMVAVLFVDLDRFKVVNDSLGHALGDSMLQETALRLQQALGGGGTLARFGSDSFTVLAEGIVRPLEATHLAERLQQTLADPFVLDGQEVFCSASVGVAIGVTGHEPADELLRDADAALTRAKALGKGRMEVFDRAMHAEAMARLQLESELRRAIERCELRLHFQPVVALDTGEITSFEALLRWTHAERGEISPSTFVPVAEETGLIVPLGRWVIDECCGQLRRWREADPEFDAGICLNLSARQFEDPELVEHIQRAQERNRLPPRSVTVEITETVLLERTGPAVEILDRLRASGVRVSMDDFGTGYSSLGYLHRFPLDLVKIDRSFVRRMDRDGRSAQLVHAIVSLARNLRVRVVAEGVETQEQLAALRGMGCDFAQGFLFAEALPPDRAAALAAERQRW